MRGFSRCELLEVYAGAEGTTGTSNEHDPDIRVVTDEFGSSVQVERALVIHRVEQLRPIQYETAESIFLLENHRIEFHG